MPRGRPGRFPAWASSPPCSWRGVGSSVGDGTAMLIAARLPATTERLVQCDSAGVDRRFRFGQIILGGKLGTLGVEQLKEAGSSLLIAHSRKIGGAFALGALFD